MHAAAIAFPLLRLPRYRPQDVPKRPSPVLSRCWRRRRWPSLCGECLSRTPGNHRFLGGQEKILEAPSIDLHTCEFRARKLNWTCNRLASIAEQAFLSFFEPAGVLHGVFFHWSNSANMFFFSLAQYRLEMPHRLPSTPSEPTLPTPRPLPLRSLPSSSSESAVSRRRLVSLRPVVSCLLGMWRPPVKLPLWDLEAATRNSILQHF